MLKQCYLDILWEMLKNTTVKQIVNKSESLAGRAMKYEKTTENIKEIINKLEMYTK